MTNHAFKTGMNEIGVTSDGFKLSALLFVPENADAEQPKPGIVIARPGTGVKEQTAAVYAEALCKLGFVTLAFDAKGFGDSEGQHKQVENPYSVVEDIKNCTSFLNSLAIVDSSKLFNVGICMGAGYAYYATALDARVKAVGMISLI
ncbi:alpha/beta hydrolase [Enterovibrio coralii]|uniref:Serine aminopeptidase S33 domain-containing protein n=1 Tax=Enterovibrio coralii TaxID=294935 RepID=A0A135I4Y8_9GAMM|nr:alpha/beta hydrolase [Enterovibrio coralii]KXF80502.1 hypothetical protein ATN88_07370 [Enterovibrio coralii]